MEIVREVSWKFGLTLLCSAIDILNRLYVNYWPLKCSFDDWIPGNETFGRSRPTRQPHRQLCNPVGFCSFP